MPRNDFNGDGLSDFLWRHEIGWLSNWISAPGGSLANVNNFGTIPFEWAIFDTGDFNGDGYADILWGQRPTQGLMGDVTVWLGNAQGRFTDNGIADGANTAFFQGVGDFNGDGRDDVLFWTPSVGDGNVWYGAVNGGFSVQTPSLPFPWQMGVVAISDFNGDGREDILWMDLASGLLKNWLGQDSGEFYLDAPDHVATSGWGAIGTGDINGDGRTDVLFQHSSGLFTNWLGAENGGFIANNDAALTSLSPNWHVNRVADFNGDGRDDILWRNLQIGGVSLWLGEDDGGFELSAALPYAAVSQSWWIADMGDYNGDGREDLLWRNMDTGRLSGWLGSEDGGFDLHGALANTSVAPGWIVGPDWEIWF